MITINIYKVFPATFLMTLLAICGGTHAFEVSGETFEAEFKMTSWNARTDGSTITSEGYLGDKYGKVYLTHNLEGRSGNTVQGNFTGQLRSINNQGDAITASLQGIWKRNGKILTLHTLDEFSSGMMLYATGIVDLIDGTLKFIVYPMD